MARLQINSKLSAPCKDCEHHDPTCHSTCAAYLKYAADREIEREEQQRRRYLEAQITRFERSRRIRFAGR